MNRFVIEGTWHGRVVHRSVHPASSKKLRAWVESTYGIGFRDGTQLVISGRDCMPRERVQEINGYSKLIADCAFHDVDSVDALIAAEKKS